MSSSLPCKSVAYVMLSLTCCQQIAKAEQKLSSKRSLAFSKAVVEVQFAEEAMKKIRAIAKIDADPKLFQAEVNKRLLYTFVACALSL